MGVPILKTYLIIPDIHVPYHCPKAVKLITAIIKELDISGLVQLGDFVDAFQLSKYSKCPSRRNLIAEDIEDFKGILNEWARNLKTGAHIHILEGNHEKRLSTYIAGQCRELHGLVPDWPTMLGIDLRNKTGRHKWHWHPYMKWDSCQIGDVTFNHGFYYNQHCAATALAKYKTNIIFGHTHRVQYVTDGIHYACSLGHISNEKETAHNPVPTGWTQALGLLHVDKVGKSKLDLLPIQNGRTVLYGKAFGI
jgi:predicted phosphodiesterase